MLSEHVSRYIELHRSLGFKFRLQAYLLNHFVRFAESRGDTTVRSESVLAWASEAPSAAQRRSRLLVVRRFSLSLQAEDARHEVPPADAFGRPTKERPHATHLFAGGDSATARRSGTAQAERLPPSRDVCDAPLTSRIHRASNLRSVGAAT